MKPPAPTPTEALSGIPASQDALALGETNLQPTSLSDLQPAAGDDAWSPAAGAGSSAGRYQLLERHAQGGLGEIFRAEDQELHRQVALKRLKPERGAALHQARFLQEAELTAELEHPGVVPVYGLVHDSADHPCYAMRFVEGPTLADAAQRFHAGLKDAPDTAQQFRGVEFRQLLQRFIAVCNTVAFAHSRGILHRDLKPANIMVGPYGETLLLDWGLAKRLGSATLPEVDSEVSLNNLPPTLISGSAPSAPQLTQAGQILGTPAYMSPEQVDGLTLTPAADVYGLGAILYELLTGQPPVPPSDLREVLTKVREGKVAAPRAVQPAGPRGLEAIAQKALARNPFERYPSALDLARDVESWLADEPLAALPDSRWTKARRWTRRHRTLMATIVASLVVAVLALIATTLLLGRKNQDLEQANQREHLAAQREAGEAQRAARNYQRAQDLIEQLLMLAESRLIHLPAAEGVREEMLNQALAQQLAIQAEHPNDPKVQYYTGRALLRVAVMEGTKGQQQAEAQRLKEAIPLLEAASQALPDFPPAPQALAQALSQLGYLERNTGRVDLARAHYDEALATLRRIIARWPNQPELLREYLKIGLRLMWIHLDGNQVVEAKECLRELEPWLTRLLALPQPEPEDYRLAASIGHFRANVARLQGETTVAEPAYAEALRLYDEVPASFRDNRWYREYRTGCHADYARFLTDQGQIARAEAELTKALALCESLARDFARDYSYRNLVAVNLILRAELREQLKRPAEAEADWAAALATYQTLSSEEQLRPAVALSVARLLNNRAHWLLKHQRIEECLAASDHAIGRQTALADRYPDVVDYKVVLGGLLSDRGTWLRLAERHADAVPFFRAAIARLEPAAGTPPKHALARDFSSKAHAGLATSLEELKDYPAAAEAYGQAAALTSEESAYLRFNRLDMLIKSGNLATARREFDAYEVPDGIQGGYCLDFSRIPAFFWDSADANEKPRRQEQTFTLLERARLGGSFHLAERREMLTSKLYDPFRHLPQWKELEQRIAADLKAKNGPKPPAVPDNPPPSP